MTVPSYGIPVSSICVLAESEYSLLVEVFLPLYFVYRKKEKESDFLFLAFLLLLHE